MRQLSVTGLLALLAALAGCGAPESLPPQIPLTLEQGAERFHDKAANASPSADKIPQKYTDSANQPVDLLSFRGRPVVLVIVKGFPPEFNAFCQGCLAQVNALVANFSEFKARGAEVLLLFPGSPDKLPEYLRLGRVDGTGGNLSVPFPILLDPDLKAVDALGIRGSLAKQSTFIINKQGDVVFGYVGNPTDSWDRPSIKALLAQLDKLDPQKK